MMKGEFEIRPIRLGDLDHVTGACWENRQTQVRLLEIQEILGFGAWEGDACVGQLHCYRVTLPQWDDSNFPGYGRARPEGWPLGWPLLAAREKGLKFDRPAWGHACWPIPVILNMLVFISILLIYPLTASRLKWLLAFAANT